MLSIPGWNLDNMIHIHMEKECSPIKSKIYLLFITSSNDTVQVVLTLYEITRNMKPWDFPLGSGHGE